MSSDPNSPKQDNDEKTFLQLWGHSWEKLTQKQKQLVIEVLNKLRKR